LLALSRRSLMWKPEGNGPHGPPILRWDNTKMDLKEVGWRHGQHWSGLR